MNGPPARRCSGIGLLLLALLLVACAAVHLGRLDHAYLPGWDEAVHAAVAGNLAEHPLTPTLFDDPLLPLNPANWQANHVWLHMPPLPFWQAALSLRLLGRGFFALRLPGLLLFLLTLAGVYLLGVRLAGEAEGLLAALLLAASPLGWLLVQGYHFGDMTDVSLAFWLTATVLLADAAVSSGRTGLAVLSGLCQGLAWLSKSALSLAPAGALLVLWLAGRRGRLAGDKPRGVQVAVHWAVAALLAAGWQIYTRLRWPAEAAIEGRALLQHVTSNYEGHGRSWDALFNDLVANLLSPAFIVWALAGALAAAAWFLRRRSRGAGWLALWCWGTWLPLLVVKTKVPAVLWGMLPALALAMAWLLLRLVRRPSPAGCALLLTPALFLLATRHAPGDFFAFARPLLPAMAVWPHLPLELLLLAALLPPCWLAARLARRLPGPAARARPLLRPALVLAATLPLAALVHEQGETRLAFATFQDFNPGAGLARQVAVPPAAGTHLLIEGRGDGRQRPELTFSFLTGIPAEMHAGPALLRAARAGLERGPLLLASPWRRRGRELAAPRPGCGYWLYQADGSTLPPPRLDGEGAEPGDFPVALLTGSVSAASVRPAGPIDVLVLWRFDRPVHSCRRRLWLVADGGRRYPAFARPAALPPGLAAEALAKLAPAGWFDGWRPFCAGLCEPGRARAGSVMADAVHSWLPADTPPGAYRLLLETSCLTRPGRSRRDFTGPALEVTP